MIKDKYYSLTILISLISFFLSVYYSQFHYDGHHFGLVYDNAKDLIDGKKPYKEIFLLYGIGTALMHSLALKLFGLNIQSLMIFTSIIYSLSLTLIFLISKKLLDKKSSFIIIFLIFLIHPVVVYPWANYLVFFFFLIGFIFLASNSILFSISALSIGTCFLIRQETFFYTLFSVFLIFLLSIFNYKFSKRLNYKKTVLFLTIAIVPSVLFLIYLFTFDLFQYYKNYFFLPEIYLSFKETNIVDLTKQFLNYLLFPNFGKIFNQPYLILFILILFFNTYNVIHTFYLSFKKKIEFTDIYLFLISISSILFISQSLNEINIFRLICGTSIGLITVFIYLAKFEKYNYNNLVLILILISLSGMSLFTKNSSNTIYKYKTEISESVLNTIIPFEKNKYKKNTTLNLQTTSEVLSSISNNCQIKYFSSLQYDIAYRIIAKKNFKTIKNLPFYGETNEAYAFIKNFDKNFIDDLKQLIENKQIVLIIDYKNKDHIKFYNEKIFFKGYKIAEILPFSYEQKFKVILIPDNCELTKT